MLAAKNENHALGATLFFNIMHYALRPWPWIIVALASLVVFPAEKIVKTVKTTGAIVTGPIPLPTKKKIFTVLKSPHVNKKSREQFQLSSYKRLLDIYSSSSKTIDALMKLELPSGVEVEIKV